MNIFELIEEEREGRSNGVLKYFWKYSKSNQFYSYLMTRVIEYFFIIEKSDYDFKKRRKFLNTLEHDKSNG